MILYMYNKVTWQVMLAVLSKSNVMGVSLSRTETVEGE